MGGNCIRALVGALVSLCIIVFLLVGILVNSAPRVPSTEKVKTFRFSGKDVNLFHVSNQKVPNGPNPTRNRKTYTVSMQQILCCTSSKTEKADTRTEAEGLTLISSTSKPTQVTEDNINTKLETQSKVKFIKRSQPYSVPISSFFCNNVANCKIQIGRRKCSRQLLASSNRFECLTGQDESDICTLCRVTIV